VRNLHQLTWRHHAIQQGHRIVTIDYCDVTSPYVFNDVGGFDLWAVVYVCLYRISLWGDSSLEVTWHLKITMSKSVSGKTTGSGAGGTAWCGPVLGEAYRSRRCVSAAAAGGVSAAPMTPSAAKKSSTSARLPKTARPGRALQMFASVRRGVQSVSLTYVWRTTVTNGFWQLLTPDAAWT